MINKTYKVRNGHGRGNQVIDRKIQHLVASGAWKDLQDNKKEVRRDFKAIPISERPT
jgi:hypothetical protein